MLPKGTTLNLNYGAERSCGGGKEKTAGKLHFRKQAGRQNADLVTQMGGRTRTAATQQGRDFVFRACNKLRPSQCSCSAIIAFISPPSPVSLPHFSCGEACRSTHCPSCCRWEPNWPRNLFSGEAVGHVLCRAKLWSRLIAGFSV